MDSIQTRNARRRSVIAMFLCAAAGCLLMAVVIGLLAVRSESQDAPSDGGYRGSEPPARFDLPSFELRSYTGVRVESDDLSGRVVLLTILDAQCTDVCPILASVIAGAIDRLTPAERDQVSAVGITGDPAEDTAVAVRQFLANHQAVGRLDYLLGSEEQLRPLWTSLQILPSLDSGRDTVHSAPLRIYGRDGVWLATLHAGADLTEANLLHDIRTALAADNKTAGYRDDTSIEDQEGTATATTAEAGAAASTRAAPARGRKRGRTRRGRGAAVELVQ